MKHYNGHSHRYSRNTGWTNASVPRIAGRLPVGEVFGGNGWPGEQHLKRPHRGSLLLNDGDSAVKFQSFGSVAGQIISQHFVKRAEFACQFIVSEHGVLVAADR